MQVHLFATASSPGCANFVHKHLASEGQAAYCQDTVKFIQRNLYVDDRLVSVMSDTKAVQLMKEARELRGAGKLGLHKFVCNRKKVLESIPDEECAESVKERDITLGEPLMERALGVHWCVSSDYFQFRVTVKEHPLTRRGVLCILASIYDPLGFVAPFILLGKEILQQMCKENIGWDMPLPEELRTQWEAWLQDLPNVSQVKIRRCFIPTYFTDIGKYELHHFSDASVTGYGECSYLWVVDTDGKVHCSLVIGKVCVAPTKVTIIPRLESSAAVVTARMSIMLWNELNIDYLQEYFWTDSRVVLGHINNNARRFHVFIANRIQRIKSTRESKQWRYVKSDDNPADHASRGLGVDQLIASNWFTGPAFLWEKELPIEEMKVGEVIDTEP